MHKIRDLYALDVFSCRKMDRSPLMMLQLLPLAVMLIEPGGYLPSDSRNTSRGNLSRELKLAMGEGSGK